ncbi:hypothetical protein [Streptomyces sp. MST-110588]|uniref:hypothetical protein n=1 Tax=Streptomyces sp. MST-110588 TaxID=2833628 RepID=UPI001F5D9889|nr:hypothetical protein [Streptomyces sp. MST-110588]UNO38521.1 hypothetical protein KGS77_01225 [Streptomyces sp. MST-110588]
MSSVLAVTVGGSLLSGCAGTGEPRSAGRTPVASAPARLWPERTPAPQPSSSGKDDEETRPSPLPGGPRVTSGDIRNVPLFDVVKAQVAAGSDNHGGPQFDRATAARINNCAHDRKRCPVRSPQYRDLNGDGKEELIVGIESPDNILVVWVFMLKRGSVMRVLDAAATPLSVEVAGRDIILREPTGTAGYYMRSVYSWDEQTQSMSMRAMEFDRADPAVTSRSTPSSTPGNTPKGTPRSTPGSTPRSSP